MYDKSSLKRSDLLYPELSYRINGVLFEVFKKIGPGHLERHYQKAIEMELEKKGIKFKRQFYLPVKYGENFVGKRFVDLLIDGIVVMEIKKGQFIPAQTITQTLDYLKILNLQLGIVACFTSKGVFIKRVLNIY